MWSVVTFDQFLNWKLLKVSKKINVFCRERMLHKRESARIFFRTSILYLFQFSTGCLGYNIDSKIFATSLKSRGWFLFFLKFVVTGKKYFIPYELMCTF